MLAGHMADGSLTIEQSPLYVAMVTKPPSRLTGQPADGIEYYYCYYEDCDFLWAMQWSPQPRKRVWRSMTLDSYKKIAIPRLCRVCREAFNRQSSVEEEGHQREKQQAETQCDKSEKRGTETREDTSRMMSTAGFEDIPLGAPAEEEDQTLAKNLSWDVIEESEANEEWSIINHFGSAAIEHGDAHMDTELARP
ncbi:hypothetical protein AYO20_04783 [Fonsecaea nubica]|uniref:Uncharacterized protein n=1 Tax=Fonsecaea nubica TaxID=856822 RepID=A0A178D2I9_9EURO|nr:hypothetical protein AYO20_04783 [Fonsecaea nubica]OAL35877.1 hypothetical protein AYO20_04783 [Fonsecaea nubica]